MLFLGVPLENDNLLIQYILYFSTRTKIHLDMNFEIILFLVHALIVLGKPAHQDEGMSFTVKHSGMKKKIVSIQEEVSLFFR